MIERESERAAVAAAARPIPCRFTAGGAMVLELGGTVLDLGEIVMAGGMLTAHLPSSYAAALGMRGWAAASDD